MNSPVSNLTSARHFVGWTVLGSGAIGLLAACRWQLAAQAVQLWPRLPQSPMQHGLQVLFQQQQQLHPLRLPLAKRDVALPINRLLLPLKAFAIVDAVRQMLPFLTHDAQLVLCHNGMGTLEQVLPLLGPAQGLWFASTTHAALKSSANQIAHTGIGNSMLAPCNDAARSCVWSIAKELDQALGPLQQVADIQPLLWRKLAINSVINPLTALHQVPNGALRADTYQRQIQLLLNEFQAVAAACGQSFSMMELNEALQQVLNNTAANFSSMQQDFYQQRPSELEFITGYLLRQATTHQLSTPTHQALYQALQQVAQRPLD